MKNKVTRYLLDEAGSIGIELHDKITIPSKRHLTDSGQMIVPCAFARTGVQRYSAEQLGLKDMDPSTVVEVNRRESEVFHVNSLASFRSAPVTLGHPKEAITSKNSEQFQVGMLEGMPVRDEDTLTGTLVLSNQKAIDALDEMQELSAGYTCDITQDEDGKFFQTNIRANHIAIVAKGRAGSGCRIADEEAGKGKGDDDEAAKNLVRLTDELSAVTSKLTAVKDAMEELKAQSKADLDLIKGDIDKKVIELVDVITTAKEISDVKDFAGKTVQEIKREVVAEKCKGVSLDDKDASYIAARFDILVEGIGETPTGKLLRDNAVAPDPAKLVDPALEARKRMIDRMSGSTTNKTK